MCVVTVLGVTQNDEQEEIQSLPSWNRAKFSENPTDPADKRCDGEALRVLTRGRCGKAFLKGVKTGAETGTRATSSQ